MISLTEPRSAQRALLRLPGLLFVIAAFLIMKAIVSGKGCWGTYSLVGLELIVAAMILTALGIHYSQIGRPLDPNQPRFMRAIVYGIFAHVVIAVLLIWNSPGYTIDTFVFAEQATQALLHGVNPYTLTGPNIYGDNTPFYSPDVLSKGRVMLGFPYPPASLFFLLPASLLGETRYAYISAVALSVLAMARIRLNWFTGALCAVLLFSPITFFVEQNSWTEPFVLLALSWTVYAALKRRWWLPLALGVLFASKQYSVLTIPFVALLLPEFSWKSYLKLTAQAISVASALTLPMAFWDFSHFWSNVVMFEVLQPFRKDALSFSVLVHIPMLLIILAVTAGTAWTLRVVKRHPAMFPACFAFTFTIFVCTNKQAFANYYFLIAQSLCLAAVAFEIPPAAKKSFPQVSLGQAGYKEFATIAAEPTGASSP